VPKCKSIRKKFSNRDLPPGCQDNNLWRGVVVPTYEHYLSFSLHDDPWNFRSERAVEILQKVWDNVYDGKTPIRHNLKMCRPAIRHIMEPGEAVFAVVST
jgi:hypothetical protein